MRGALWPIQSRTMAEAPTSMAVASISGLPVSRVTAVASSSLRRSRTWAASATTRPRSRSGVRAHARRAIATSAATVSTASGGVIATRPRVSPVVASEETR